MAKTGASTTSSSSSLKLPFEALEAAIIRVLLVARDLPPKLLKSGGINKRFIDTTLESLEGSIGAPGVAPDTVMEFLVMLAKSAGLLREADEQLLVDAAACDSYFAQPAGERRAGLVMAWRESSDIDEFSSLPNLRIVRTRNQRSPGARDCVPGANQLSNARSKVVSALKNLDEDWVGIHDFQIAMWKRDPALLYSAAEFPLATVPHYTGIRLQNAKEDLVREGNWDLVEGALIEELIRLPLFLLGCVELSQSDSNAPADSMVFRPLAEEDDSFADVKPAAQALTINPNFEVMALLPEMSAQEIWGIAKLSTLVSWGQVATFKLDEKYVASVINSGVSTDSVLQFLSDHSRNGVPENVAYALRDWSQKTERIVIFLDAALIEAEGREDLSALLAESESGEAEIRQLTAQHIVTSVSNLNKVKSNDLARATAIDYSRRIPPVLVAEEDGTLSCKPGELHFRLQRLLNQIAKPDALDHWRVDRDAVREALNRGARLDDIVQGIQDNVRHELPPSLQARLLAWAGKAGELVQTSLRTLYLSNSNLIRYLMTTDQTNDIFAFPLNANTFDVSHVDEKELNAFFGDLDLSIDESDTRPDSSSLPGGSPAQLAKVVRARRDLSASSQFNALRFQSMWEENRLAALEYATSCGAPLSLKTRSAHDPLGSREVIEPRLLISYSDGAILEAVRRSDLSELLIHVDQISEASPL